MTREDLEGKIQTVLGPVEPAKPGPTLMHEHLLCDITPPTMADWGDGPEITLANRHEIAYGRTKHAGNYRLTMPDVATDEVRSMYAAGGRAIVELTVGGLKPDPEGLAEIARATGVHIVMGCGHYVEAGSESIPVTVYGGLFGRAKRPPTGRTCHEHPLLRCDLRHRVLAGRDCWIHSGSRDATAARC